MAQTALVTGATSGIGEALCLLFASDDFDLVTVARDKEALEKQADELRRLDIDVLPIACDLSDPDAARTIFKRVQEAGKEIEILVNDAGYSPAGQFSDLPIADIRSMIQVSVTSLAELTSVFLHPMLERGHGRILNMSSMMAKTPCPYNALYGAAKVFVLSFSTALARELKHTGVSVTTVCPGATRTNFPKNAGIEDAPAWKYFSMDTDETAIRVYRALMRGERCAVTGWYNKVGSISVRLMPMGMQLLAGEWLMGARKHPLDHEGTEEGSHEDGRHRACLPHQLGSLVAPFRSGRGRLAPAASASRPLPDGRAYLAQTEIRPVVGNARDAGVRYLHRIVHALRVDEVHERAHDERMRYHQHVAAAALQPIIAGLAEEPAQAPLDGIEALGAAGAIRIRQHVGHLGQPPIVLLERQRRAEPRVERGVQQLSRLALEVAVAPFAQTHVIVGTERHLAPPRAQQLVERVHGTAAVA